VIDLIPGHGWLDLAGVGIVVLVAFGVFFLGLAATVARVRDWTSAICSLARTTRAPRL